MTEPTTTAPETRSDPGDELHRLREENLRLRDLLIHKDAELGTLKGQVAAMEAGTGRLLGLLGIVRRLTPGFLWRALSRLSRLATRG